MMLDKIMMINIDMIWYDTLDYNNKFINQI